MKTLKFMSRYVTLLPILLLLLSCHRGDDPFQPKPADNYSVTLLLVDSNDKNIIDYNSVGPQYDYRAISDCRVELVSPKTDGIKVELKARYVADSDEEKVPYLHISSWKELEDGEAKTYEAEFTIYSEYIFRDKQPHHIKVVHEPVFLRQKTVYVDGVAYPSVQKSSINENFFYSTYVVPWN